MKYRELKDQVKLYGVLENRQRGKGSERVFFCTKDGVTRSYPLKCHGENDDVRIGILHAFLRRFGLKLNHQNNIIERDMDNPFA